MDNEFMNYFTVTYCMITSTFNAPLLNKSILDLIIISAVPVQNVPVQNGPIAWPQVLLLAAFSRTAHPSNFIVNTALPLVLSNTPAKCEVHRMNDCRDNRRTDRQTDRDSFHLWLDTKIIQISEVL